jgi:hypothetical protein
MMALQREEFEKSKQFFEARVKMEEQYRKLRHKYYEEQYKLQMAQIGLQAKYAKMMEQAQKDLQKVKDAQEDQLGRAKVLQSMYPTLLDYLQRIGIKFKELILDPLADKMGIAKAHVKTYEEYKAEKSVGGHGGGSNYVPPVQRASGGSLPPGLNYVHEGEVLVKSNEPMMVVPKWEASDFMSNYYALNGSDGDNRGNIHATLTVVLATEGLREIVREVIHEEVGPIR